MDPSTPDRCAELWSCRWLCPVPTPTALWVIEDASCNPTAAADDLNDALDELARSTWELPADVLALTEQIRSGPVDQDCVAELVRLLRPIARRRRRLAVPPEPQTGATTVEPEWDRGPRFGIDCRFDAIHASVSRGWWSVAIARAASPFTDTPVWARLVDCHTGAPIATQPLSDRSGTYIGTVPVRSVSTTWRVDITTDPATPPRSPAAYRDRMAIQATFRLRYRQRLRDPAAAVFLAEEVIDPATVLDPVTCPNVGSLTWAEGSDPEPLEEGVGDD